MNDFQFVIINGTKITARRFYLNALVAAHNELVALGIGVNGKKGFVSAPERTASFRSLALQQGLVASGASRTLFSNHRRGTAVDCYSDWHYIKQIQPTMEKHGLTNDLAYIDTDARGNIIRHDSNPFDGSYVDADEFKAWDGGHYNWGSNEIAQGFDIVNSLTNVTEFKLMKGKNGELIQLIDPGQPGSGGFAFVKDGKKQVISEARLAAAVASVLCEKFVNRKEWNDIPTEKDF